MKDVADRVSLSSATGSSAYKLVLSKKKILLLEHGGC
jgi:hypothetical protein